MGSNIWWQKETWLWVVNTHDSSWSKGTPLSWLQCLQVSFLSWGWSTTPRRTKLFFFPGLLFWNDMSQEWLGKMRGHTEAVAIGKNEVILRRKKSSEDAESWSHCCSPCPNSPSDSCISGLPMWVNIKDKYQHEKHISKIYDQILITLIIQVLWF